MGQGTWKKADSSYEVTLPDNKPDTVAVTLANDAPLPFPVLQFPRDGRILVFNKETPVASRENVTR